MKFRGPLVFVALAVLAAACGSSSSPEDADVVATNPEDAVAITTSPEDAEVGTTSREDAIQDFVDRGISAEAGECVVDAHEAAGFSVDDIAADDPSAELENTSAQAIVDCLSSAEIDIMAAELDAGAARLQLVESFVAAGIMDEEQANCVLDEVEAQGLVLVDLLLRVAADGGSESDKVFSEARTKCVGARSFDRDDAIEDLVDRGVTIDGAACVLDDFQAAGFSPDEVAGDAPAETKAALSAALSNCLSPEEMSIMLGDLDVDDIRRRFIASFVADGVVNEQQAECIMDDVLAQGVTAVELSRPEFGGGGADVEAAFAEASARCVDG